MQSRNNLGDFLFSDPCPLQPPGGYRIPFSVECWQLRGGPRTLTFLWLLLIRSPSHRPGSWGTWHLVSKAFLSSLSKNNEIRVESLALAMVAHTIIPSIQEAESDDLCEFQASHGVYDETLSQNKTNNTALRSESKYI